jgi:hypothetical protein
LTRGGEKGRRREYRRREGGGGVQGGGIRILSPGGCGKEKKKRAETKDTEIPAA